MHPHWSNHFIQWGSTISAMNSWETFLMILMVPALKNESFFSESLSGGIWDSTTLCVKLFWWLSQWSFEQWMLRNLVGCKSLHEFIFDFGISSCIFFSALDPTLFCPVFDFEVCAFPGLLPLTLRNLSANIHKYLEATTPIGHTTLVEVLINAAWIVYIVSPILIQGLEIPFS